MKTYLTSACVVLALTAMLASCKEKSGGQDPEPDSDLKLNLSVNWRNLEQKPSSMTLYCYPTGNAVIDTTRHIFHFDA